MNIDSWGLLVGLGGLISTVVIFILQNKERIRLQKSSYVFRLNDKYDEICHFGATHPAVMALASRWPERPLADSGLQEISPEQRAYCFFAGMSLGFFETAVYSYRVAKVLTEKEFEDWVRPMMRQLVRRNLPAFKGFAVRGSLSAHSKQMLAAP
ncbi:MAG: hypothetical protein FJ109_21080, partial [Deltaproteobacteria bacterium]|nr:hypothetical protein [Deltaproteobacteria bacterium]